MYVVHYGYSDEELCPNPGFKIKVLNDAQEVGEFFTEFMKECEEVCIEEGEWKFRVFECAREVELKEVEKVTVWALAEKE